MKKLKTKKTKSTTKTTPAQRSIPTLGKIVLVHTKSSTYGFALLEPKIVSIDDLKFLEGIQVTGKENHRMERKRTLLPFDHVASIVEFETEDDLWKHSQPRPIQTSEEPAEVSAPRLQQPPHRKHDNRRHNRKHRPRNYQESGVDNDAHLQAKYDASHHRKFTK